MDIGAKSHKDIGVVGTLRLFSYKRCYVSLRSVNHKIKVAMLFYSVPLIATKSNIGARPHKE